MLQQTKRCQFEDMNILLRRVACVRQTEDSRGQNRPQTPNDRGHFFVGGHFGVLARLKMSSVVWCLWSILSSDI